MDEVNDAYMSSLKWSEIYSSPTVSWDGHCNIMDYISDTYGSSPIQSDINASPVVTCNGDNNIMDNLSGAAIFSPIWSETNTSPMVTWNGTTISPADGLHATSAEQYGEVANPLSCMASSSQIAVTTTSGDSNMQECKTSSYAISENNLTHFRYFGSTAAATSFELDRPYSALPTYSSIERKNDELSAFQQSLTFCSGVSSSMGLDKLPDFDYQGNESSSCNLVETTPQNGSFYSDIYHSASMPIGEQNDLRCLSSFLVERQTNLIADSLQPKMEQAGLHSPSLPSGTCLMSSNEAARITMAQQAQIDSIDLSSFSDGHRKILISSALLQKMEQNGLYSLAFSSGPSMMTSNKLAGLPSAQKLATSSQAYAARHQIYDSSGSQSHFVPDTGNHCNEPDKPRVRARRGEATDPHSIAEKHRRKRISERLKDLQRLVPGANKTDKASILDEIINYVRFLQLQVKGNLFPSASVGRGRSDHTDTDSLAFKQQVLNLMEVDVTSAAQYLEDRGLSLIPMASAAKISMQRGAFAAVPH